jgi:hypothetical protein
LQLRTSSLEARESPAARLRAHLSSSLEPQGVVVPPLREPVGKAGLRVGQVLDAVQHELEVRVEASFRGSPFKSGSGITLIWAMVPTERR